MLKTTLKYQVKAFIKILKHLLILNLHQKILLILFSKQLNLNSSNLEIWVMVWWEEWVAEFLNNRWITTLNRWCSNKIIRCNNNFNKIRDKWIKIRCSSNFNRIKDKWIRPRIRYNNNNSLDNKYNSKSNKWAYIL